MNLTNLSNINKETSPSISVVIPFFNNQVEVTSIIESILNQNYSGTVQIICVDNGSSREFIFSQKLREQITFLEEHKNLNSPYSARNRGIEVSMGDIIVLLDANSNLNNNDWLQYGVSCMLKTNSDIIAGNVLFDYGDKITASKIADALTSINMRKAAIERGVAYTANLFVKKKVFEKNGLFEEGIRSGGDTRWTAKAVKKGFVLKFCEKAFVHKKARPFISLLRKRIRTGKGYYHSWKLESNRRLFFYNFLRSLKPPSYKNLWAINKDRYQSEFEKFKLQVWFVVYLAGIIEQISFLDEYFRNR